MTDLRDRLERLVEFLDASLTIDPKPALLVHEGRSGGLDVFARVNDSTSLCLQAQRILDLLEELPSDRHYEALTIWADRANEMLVLAADAKEERTVVTMAVRAHEQSEALGLLWQPTANPMVDQIVAYDTSGAVMPILESERNSATRVDQLFADGIANVKNTEISVTVSGEGAERCVSINAYYAATIALVDPDRVRTLAMEHDIPAPWILCVPERSTAVITSAQRPRHVLRTAMVCTEVRASAESRVQLFSSPLELSPSGHAGMPIAM